MKVTANIDLLPNKLLVQKGLKLPVMELFYTIQGEGVHSGMPAVFLRLAGCDVGCHWCDVKESWDALNHPIKSIEEIIEEISGFGCKNVVITGGEPTMFNLEPLTKTLSDEGYLTFIETSAAYPITGVWHWICISPKKTKPPLTEALNEADELKVVIYNKHDFKWAESHVENVSESCELLMQPEWGRQKEMTPQVIAYVKDNPKWKISLQTHKYMGIP